MLRTLRRMQSNTWKLSRGAPFPDEFQIDYDKKRKHGGIKPAARYRIKPAQLKEVNLVG